VPHLENPLPPRFVPGSWTLLIVVVLLFSGPVVAGADPAVGHPATAPAGMVVAPELHAAEVGRRVLREGGNAIDAAVASSFMLSVTYPLAAPIGGGGFLLYRDENADHHALDFRERAPKSLTPELFLDEQGQVIAGLSLDSGLAVGVPGSVAGLYGAHRRWGSRPWKALLQPAIDLATEGFVVDRFLAGTLTKSVTHLERHRENDALLQLDEGQTLTQPDLARTLRRIQRRGPDGFYRGPVARAITRTVRRHGGVMQADDLRGYRATEREPLRGSYRGFSIVTFPPPSSGGAVLLQILGMLELQGPLAGVAIHPQVEACRRAYADRARWMGDPDSYDVPLAGLTDRRYLQERIADIDPVNATPSDRVTHGAPIETPPGDDDETLHLSITDAEGRAVAMTLTLNRWYGTGFVADGTGVFLNNELDDFALQPGVPNLYGLIGGEANAVAGGRRPLSSMTPVVVEDGDERVRMVLGSPGGSRIITAVLQVLLRHLSGQPIEAAVSAQRWHHQWLPDQLQIETMPHDGTSIPDTLLQDLRDRGHQIVIRDTSFGSVGAIVRDADGRWVGAPDPRRDGVARGY